METVASENADMTSKTSSSLTGLADPAGHLIDNIVSTISTVSTYIGMIIIALAVFGIAKSVRDSVRGY